MRIKRSKENLEKLQQIYAFGEGGSIAFSLHLFGDHLADREGYQNLDGIEALHFYLVHKFGWLPSKVRAMSYKDLEFVLLQEKQGWTWPVEARAFLNLLPDQLPTVPTMPRRKPR